MLIKKLSPPDQIHKLKDNRFFRLNKMECLKKKYLHSLIHFSTTQFLLQIEQDKSKDGIKQFIEEAVQEHNKCRVKHGVSLEFNIYTPDLLQPSAPVQVMAYADDIIITSTHTSTNAAKKYIQPYLHNVLLEQNKTISY